MPLNLRLKCLFKTDYGVFMAEWWSFIVTHFVLNTNMNSLEAKHPLKPPSFIWEVWTALIRADTLINSTLSVFFRLLAYKAHDISLPLSCQSCLRILCLAITSLALSSGYFIFGSYWTSELLMGLWACSDVNLW